MPEAADFPGAAYLSLGWGDAAYFTTPDPTLAMTLSAALRPTPAVLLVTGLTAHPRDAYPRDEVIEFQVGAGGFAALVAYLDAAFDRGEAPRAWASRPGRHRFSLFYPATGEFHLFNTCNTWTAKALAAAGLPVQASGVMTAEDLMRQIRP